LLPAVRGSDECLRRIPGEYNIRIMQFALK
jgi:hypothetical protein